MTLAYDMYMVAKEAAEVAAEKAFEDGFSAGEERGRNEGKLETARSMILRNISIDIVAECTGLTPEEIEKL